MADQGYRRNGEPAHSESYAALHEKKFWYRPIPLRMMWKKILHRIINFETKQLSVWGTLRKEGAPNFVYLFSEYRILPLKIHRKHHLK